MKRLIPVAALALVLAGCSATTPDAMNDDQALTDTEFESMVSELPSYAPGGASNHEVAKQLCELREAGAEEGIDQTEVLLNFLKIATDAGFAAEDTGSFMVYATARYCPEFNDETLAGG